MLPQNEEGNISIIVGHVVNTPKLVFDTQGDIFAMANIAVDNPMNNEGSITVPALFKNNVALKVESKIIVGDIMHLEGRLCAGLSYLTDSTLMLYVEKIVEISFAERIINTSKQTHKGTSLSPLGFFK